jgi:hypothetical protein
MNNILERGAFLLSIDVEMAWGVNHTGDIAGHYTYRNEREVIFRLLGLFEKYEIRATWAIVGHLFLDECRAANGRKHLEIVRPPYSWFEGDWFDADPCANAQSAPAWYGRDIVELVRQCRVPQEVGSHSFSHILVGDPECTAESFDSELKMCRKLAEAAGITLDSFVFPRNSIGHLETLAQNGFVAYRGRTPARSFYSDMRGRPLYEIADSTWPPPGWGVYPEFQHGLWNIPATHFYGFTDRRSRSWLPIGLRLLVLKRRLRQAVRQRSLVHLWFHPHNLTQDPEGSLGGLEVIFQEVQRLRESGKLDNPTMGELAKLLSKRCRGCDVPLPLKQRKVEG